MKLTLIILAALLAGIAILKPQRTEMRTSIERVPAPIPEGIIGGTQHIVLASPLEEFETKLNP